MSSALGFLSAPVRAPAECVIRVRDVEIDNLYPLLESLTVETGRTDAGVATLVFESRRDEAGRFAVLDDRVLVPWAPIRIEAAFGVLTEEVFRGYIRSVSASFPESPAEATVTVECQDESFALDREHVRTVWGADEPTSDDLVLETVAGRHDLVVDPDSAEGQSSLVVHQDSTDIQFLRARADANGYELLVHAGTIYFGPMRLEADPQPTILVYAGLDAHAVRLDVHVDGHRPAKIGYHVLSADGTSVERHDVEPSLTLLGSEAPDTGEDDLGEFTWFLSGEGGAGAEELAARAQQKVDEFSMRVRADAEIDGSLYGHVLRIGLPVTVDGVGDWLGGVYYVDRVTHTFTADGYVQKARLLRNAFGDDLVGGAEGALAGVL